MPALVPRSAPRRVANPKADPRFVAVTEQVKAGAAKLKKHAPPAEKARAASKSAKAPPNERLAGAKAKVVDTVKEAPAPKPQPSSFKALLRAEIEKAMPKTLGDTEKFMQGQQAGAMKGSLAGNVGQQKATATGPVDAATKKAPDPGAVPATPSAPLPSEPTPQPPPVAGGEAMPQPATPAEASLEQSKKDTTQALADEKIKPESLERANDPRFSAVTTTQKQVAAQADKAPAAFRAKEASILGGAKAQAGSVAARGSLLLAGARGRGNAQVLTRQQQQAQKEEEARKKVATDIEAIFARTKSKVEARLANLDTEVAALFDPGVDAALNTMKRFVDGKIFDYKLRRYLTIPGLGLARWLRDQALGLPEEVNAFYVQGRAVFQAAMDRLIDRIANLVETRLAQAKADVAAGQAEIKSYVAGLPANLKAAGQAAEKSMSDRFAELTSSIEDKKNELASSLAQKYKEAFDKADEALKQMQDENKGLLQQFAEKLGEVVKALAEFKARLMAILRKAADTIDRILENPGQFLSNLINAIKQGFQQFAGNILTHLARGFAKWLFGALAGAGIEIPSDLTLPSILKLVLGVLGITYERMRAKAVKLLGPTVVGIIEKVVEYVRALISGGPAALWEKVKEDLSDLKAMVIDAIKDWLITTIVKRAVAKVVSMFNPAGAIVQIILMIVSVVQFVVERAAQIMEFVEAVVNSFAAIAGGAIGGAASWIERALGNMVPILIGFLASLLGLGGISAKIKETILKVQNKVDKAIDKAIAKIVGVVKKLFGGKGKDKAKEKEKEKEKDKEGADVKAKVATELSGKKLKDAEEENALITAVYNKYKAEGLKGIRFKPTKSGAVDVIVSASLAEKVAQLDLSTPEGLKELARITGMMNPKAGRTTIMVYYGKGHKTFKKIGQKRGKAGHAEHWLKLEFPSLMARIRREYKTQKTPLIEPVPIHLDINRTPCDGCAEGHLKEMIEQAKSAYPDVKFSLTISAASVSQGAQLTTEKGLAALMAKDVEITSSTVWTEIEKQMKANGIKQIDYRNRHYDIDDVNEFIADAKDVQQLIDKTVTAVKKSKPKPTFKGSGA
ncbi:MAG: hypothetical protein U1F76_06940 [Candidatus Competibacteraceae bacterium]